MGKLAKAMSGQIQPGAKPFAKGGKVHDDAAMDKKMIKKAVKPSALKANPFAKGGKTKECCK